MRMWGQRTAAFIGYLFTPEDLGWSASATGPHPAPEAGGRWRGAAKAGLWTAVSILTALALGQLG